MPVQVDRREVELAKILDAQNKSQKQIAKEIGKSPRTVGRYLKYEDPPEFADELADLRRVNELKFLTDAWRVAHKMLEEAEGKLDQASVKDLIISMAVILDKIRAILATGTHSVQEDQKIEFIFKAADADTTKPIAEPGEVSQLPGEVSGDDRGEGERQDLLALPRGDKNEPGQSGDTGGNSSIDLPID